MKFITNSGKRLLVRYLYYITIYFYNQNNSFTLKIKVNCKLKPKILTISVFPELPKFKWSQVSYVLFYVTEPKHCINIK